MSANDAPNEKSPTTHTTNGAWSDRNASRGHSTKFLKFARNVALARYSVVGLGACAQAGCRGRSKHTVIARLAAVRIGSLTNEPSIGREVTVYQHFARVRRDRTPEPSKG